MDSNETEGVCYAQPVTFDDRVKIVRDFVKSCAYEIPIAIDPIDNPANAIYAGWPERFYIIGDDGTIAYKGKTGPFGYHPEEVAAWLMKRFPPEVLPLGEVAAERIESEPLSLRAIEYADSQPKWMLAIDASGRATIGKEPAPKILAVDAARVRALRRAIAEQGFFTWKEASGEPSTEGTTRSISITLGSTSKTVHLYSPDERRAATAEPSSDVQPFEMLWGWVRCVDS